VTRTPWPSQPIEEHHVSDSTTFRGRTAVVTGASSGIGRAVAERLGAAGAYVVLCGRTADAMDESVGRIDQAGGSATAVVADVCAPGTMQGLVDTAMRASNRLDIFVNNAGVGSFGTILDTDVDQWRTVFETNVLALTAGCKAAVAAMRACGSNGHIVNVSSIAAKSPDSGIYGASKHAVNVITNSLRIELLEDPIRLTTILPGVVATNFARYLDPAILEGLAAMVGDGQTIRPGERLPDEVLERAQAALSEFMVRPEDVAEAVYYAVNQPVGVDIGEIVVRPSKDLAIQ
jgi:NADP-dependent 3-hydroxy acid dehydrogenase YdfG